jgi:glyoxylase-like metal-dependent hydrolase (beta-lactamase superfamily II)
MSLESGKLEFASGVTIERLSLRMPIKDRSLTHVNVYLAAGDSEHGALLVDTGWDSDDTFDYLKRALADRPVGQIVVTHTHLDHYGLANRLKQYTNAQLYMHELEEKLIQSRYINLDELLKEVAVSLKVHGVPPAELDQLGAAPLPMRQFADPAPPDATLRGGETITTGYFNFKVLWTPGHSPGHVCLYEPDKKILLSGDHILPTITPHVGMHPQSGGNPLGDYLASLNRLKELEVATVLPGHEQPFTDFNSRVEAIIQHHQFRNSQILGALDSKSKTAYQIAHEISWVDDANGVSLDKLNHWNRRMAILETISHLEAMRANHEVDSFSRDDIIHYQRHLS